MLQGTVKSFDPETQAAVVLTDARVEYDVPAEAFRGLGAAQAHPRPAGEVPGRGRGRRPPG